MTGWEFDLDLLDRSVIRWVPFSVRYGYQTVSDFIRTTANQPPTRGILWESVTS